MGNTLIPFPSCLLVKHSCTALLLRPKYYNVLVVNGVAGDELHLGQGLLWPPPGQLELPARGSAGSGTDCAPVQVKPKRPLSTTEMGVGRAAGTEVGKGAVKEVMKPKRCPEMFCWRDGEAQLVTQAWVKVSLRGGVGPFASPAA